MTVRTRQRPRRTPSLRPRLHFGSKASAARLDDAIAARLADGAGGGVRERDAGGPEDRALYRCQCGYVFEASVSTSVGCPHCGGAQAW